MRPSMRSLAWALVGAVAIVAIVAGSRSSPRERGASPATLEAGGGAVTAREAPAPMSPTLLRRLAEAADGFRGQGPVWVVVDPNPPHAMAGEAFPSREEAEAYRRELAPKFSVFGPYQSEVTLGRDGDMAIFFKCKSPWTRYCDPTRVFVASEVDSIKVGIYSDVAGMAERVFSPYEIEAVFFNLRAFDRFLVPFTLRESGIERAMELRDSVIAEVSRGLR